MSRRILAVSISIVLILSTGFALSMGCSNSGEWGTPLYIQPGDDPFATPDRYVMSIYVFPGGVNIAVGGLQQFQAIANFNDGTTEDLAGVVEWYIESGGIGAFDTTAGRFIAQAPGVAIVRCRLQQWDTQTVSGASYINSFNPSEGLPPAVPLNPDVTPTDEGVVVNWDLNTTDGDLAGYNIWRTQVSAAHYATDYGRVNEGVWLYPPMLDKTVVSGWYFYRITAEDLIGLNSAPSEEVAVFVTGQSHYGSAYDADTAANDRSSFSDAFSTAL